ncbi:tripartite motif-containing protein 2-like [Saccostrea echinata]|uniref:tripartite motif-containing protein 2-like n=1 Tax=Saccostrea echinata TaxID=191078 RepID=UPI002A801763|nr:tripartite motif-containing protein 2-like [Saccostrea echinata]
MAEYEKEGTIAQTPSTIESRLQEMNTTLDSTLQAELTSDEKSQPQMRVSDAKESLELTNAQFACETKVNTNIQTTSTDSRSFQKANVVKAQSEDKGMIEHEEREIDYAKCNEHKDKKNDLFCQTCQKSVCERCVYLNHKTHKLVDLKEIINEKKRQFTLETDVLKFQIQWKYEEEISRMETEYKNLNEVYSQIRKAIKSTAEEWHKEVDRIANTFLSSVDKFEGIHKNRMYDEIKKLESILSEIKKIVEDNEKTLATPLELVEKEIPNVETFKKFPQVSYVNPPVFTVGSLQEVIDYHIQLDKIKFNSENLPVPYNAANGKSCVCLAELKVLNERRYPGYEIQTGITKRPKFSNPAIKIPNHKSLNDIQALSKAEAFVSDLGGRVSLIDRKGNVQMSQKLERIHFLSIGKNNDLYYTDSDEKRIVKMKFEGTESHGSDETERKKEMLTTFEVSTEDWEPKGLTITSSGHLLVCLQNEESGKIVRYSKNLEEYVPKDENLEFQIEKPERIVENKNEDICLTDMGSEKSVYIFRKNGKFRNKYQPKTAANIVEGIFKWRDTSFSPEGICTDRMGHILISDTPNKVIHILNQWGEFLQYLLRGYLYHPRAMVVDESGDLWLLEGKEKLKIVKYLNGFL